MKLVLLTNRVGVTVRREMLYGRPHLVAPVTLLVPGVLNGSEGPLYYPPDEVERDHRRWSGQPIVVYHPTDNSGNNISAHDPVVLEKYAVGVVLRPSFDSKLKAEAWFDEQRTKKVDVRVYNALIKGEPMEVSTGLFTQNEEATTNAQHEGKSYKAIARNYIPDHLAILPDQIGACSLRDGCGLNISNSCACGGTCGACPSNSGDDMKKKYIQFLTANSAAWKGGAKLLEGMPEATLKALYEDAQRAASNIAVVNCVKESYGLEDEQLTPEHLSTVLNADKMAEEEDPNEEETPKETASEDTEFPKKKKKEAPAANNSGTKGKQSAQPKLSLEDWVASAPPQYAAIWNSQMKAHQKNINKLVSALTANVKDKARKEAMTKRLSAMPLEDLEVMHEEFVGNQAKPQAPQAGSFNGIILPNFAGASPAVNVSGDDTVVDNAEGDDEEALPLPVVNFANPRGKASASKGRRQAEDFDDEE